MTDDLDAGNVLKLNCLLCGEAIVPGSFDPCTLTLTARSDRPRREQMEQTFFCHLACLESKSAVRGVFYISEPGYSTVGEMDDENRLAEFMSGGGPPPDSALH